MPLPEARVPRYGYPLAALGFGVFIAAAFVYLAYRLDHTVRSTEDLAGIPVRVLGTIPNIDSKSNRPWYRVFYRRAERDFTRRVAALLAFRTW